ncbi:MAG: CcmD family protein [Deltaproteobacteria bacterium]|nr:CcmD family protein [Deltaproteobacteria bacterium]
MGMWVYVFLAYGIVWGAILLYTLSLKRRCRAAEIELRRIGAGKESSVHAKT